LKTKAQKPVKKPPLGPVKLFPQLKGITAALARKLAEGRELPYVGDSIALSDGLNLKHTTPSCLFIDPGGTFTWWLEMEPRAHVDFNLLCHLANLSMHGLEKDEPKLWPGDSGMRVAGQCPP
jgi:hypothetical protein